MAPSAPVVPLRRAWYRRPITLLVAAAAIAAIVVGSVVLANRPGPQSATGDAAMQQCVAAAPDAHMMMPTVGAGGDVTMAHSCHAAVVRVDGLPVLPSGQTYQLWVMAPSGARSVGMLGAEPSAAAPDGDGRARHRHRHQGLGRAGERICDAFESARLDGGPHVLTFGPSPTRAAPRIPPRRDCESGPRGPLRRRAWAGPRGADHRPRCAARVRPPTWPRASVRRRPAPARSAARPGRRWRTRRTTPVRWT